MPLQKLSEIEEKKKNYKKIILISKKDILN